MAKHTVPGRLNPKLPPPAPEDMVDPVNPKLPPAADEDDAAPPAIVMLEGSRPKGRA